MNNMELEVDPGAERWKDGETISTKRRQGNDQATGSFARIWRLIQPRKNEWWEEIQ